MEKDGVSRLDCEEENCQGKGKEPSPALLDTSILEEPFWPCFSAEIQSFLLTWATSWMKYELLSLNRKAKGDDAGSGFGFMNI